MAGYESLGARVSALGATLYLSLLSACGPSHTENTRETDGEGANVIAGASGTTHSGGSTASGELTSSGEANSMTAAGEGGSSGEVGAVAAGQGGIEGTTGPGSDGGVAGEGTDDPGPPTGGTGGGSSLPTGGTGGGSGLPAGGTGGGSGLPAAGAAGLDLDSIAPPPGVLTTHKVDLLFVVDNSASMQDKQVLLAQAVPDMLAELINPPCVDESGTVLSQPDSPSATCAAGTRRVPPVRDMHVGVITSSLGGHGNAEFCEQPQENDHAHLIPTVRDIGIPGAGIGFVAWAPQDGGAAGAGAVESQPELEDAVSAMITAVGQDGCGYEAQLEAWYRFLVDPEPPASVVMSAETNTTVRQGIDQTLLDQRAAFLRPDSALVIVLLSDEDDCSIADSSYGWLASQTKIDRGTSVCASDPDDPCCTFCGYQAAPAGCPPMSIDPGCQAGEDDATNVRCWDQKRRFGIDFLYPTSRYVAALRDGVVCPDSSFGDFDCGCRAARRLGRECDPGVAVPNPIYRDLSGSGASVRDRSLVFLVSIVGVPWQDLATDDTLVDPDVLRYGPGTEVDWALVLGDPTTGTPPGDALMVPSPSPRTGEPHPLVGVEPMPPESGYLANPINGHEWQPVNNEDLQYACIFPLEPILGEPRDCNLVGLQTCDCFDPTDDLATVNGRKKPLCQDESGEYTAIQTHGKAYPSLRELQVTRDIAEAGFPASICPKILDRTSPYYGYTPALSPLLERLARVIE